MTLFLFVWAQICAPVCPVETECLLNGLPPEESDDDELSFDRSEEESNGPWLEGWGKGVIKSNPHKALGFIKEALVTFWCACNAQKQGEGGTERNRGGSDLDQFNTSKGQQRGAWLSPSTGTARGT